MAERLSVLWQALITTGLIPLCTVAWLVGNAWFYPFASYFKLGEVQIASPHKNGDEAITFTGGPRRAFLGEYKVTGRNAVTGTVACEGKASGARTYPSRSIYPPTVTMEWWEGPGGQCANLPPGSYQIETCWTVLDRPALFGPATKCVLSNPFVIEE